VIEALRRAGSLVRVEGIWVLVPGAQLPTVDLGLPDSVEGVVLSRIDRLPDAHKLTLRVASVIGRTFALDLLTQAHPLQLGMDAVQQHVDLLETHDFTALEAPPPKPVYIFKHNVTRDVAYETLLFAQRQQLHRAVGYALELLAPEATEQLAFHTFLGEDWPRALRYQMLAGERAQKLFANHEGIAHLNTALLSAEKLPAQDTSAERLEIHLGLGELLTATGQYEPALDHLDKALAIAEELHDTDAQAKACRWIARGYENRGDYPSALEWIQRGLDALGDKQTAAAAEMLAVAGLVYSRQGNHDQALEMCLDSLIMAEKLGDIAVMALGNNLLGHITRLHGNSTGAIQHFQRALDIYRQADNASGQAISQNQIANAYFDLGRWPEADVHYRLARDIFDQIGDVYNHIFVSNNLGGIALNQGRLDEALSFYREALRSLEQIGGSPYVIGVLHMNLGATFVRRGEIEAAREHLHKSREYFDQAQARDFLPEMHRHLAEAALLAGDLNNAESEGQQALSLARELAMRGEEGSSLCVLGEVAEKAGDTAQAESRLTESLAILQEVGDEYEAARTELALAELYLSQGKVQEGTAALERSTATFQRLQAAGDLAKAAALVSGQGPVMNPDQSLALDR
jgi:tetratricopeptide (TPR) repeat protein